MKTSNATATTTFDFGKKWKFQHFSLLRQTDRQERHGRGQGVRVRRALSCVQG